MKTILTVTLSLLATFSWAQSPTAAIENTEMNVLYRGYANKITIGANSKDGGIYHLTGSNASISVKGDHYIVKPGRGKTATLTVSKVNENGENTILRTKEYRIANLPDPQLYWGLTASGKAVKNQLPTLTAGYGRYFPFNPEFTVTKWYAMYNDVEYSGVGTDISSLNDLIETFSELTEVTIFATVQGPDGISRQLDGTWFIRPTKQEE